MAETGSGTTSVHITVPSLASGSGTTSVHIFLPSESASGTATVHITVAGPTVVVGPAVTLDAGQLYTITPQRESAAAGTSIVSRVWKVGGVQVGTGSTLAVIGTPTTGGHTITYSYTVTDNNGIATTDSITVNTFPAALRGPGNVPMFQWAP